MTDVAGTLSPETHAAAEAAREMALHGYLPAAARVLDCACGPAERVAALRSKGAVRVTGIAASEAIAAQAREYYDEVVVLDLYGDALPFAAGSFDGLLCHDVLARVRDAEPVMEKLRPLLAEGGQAVVTAPNIQYHRCFVGLIEGHWNYSEDGPLARPHLRFYTGAELLRLLKRHGLAATRTSALSMDPPEAFPRDEQGMVTCGRIRVGPLSENEYRTYLVREFAFLAAPAKS